MNELKHELFLMVRCALMGETAQLKDPVLREEIYHYALKHQVEAMIYDGAIRCGVSKQQPEMKNLFQYYYKVLTKNERQMIQLDALYRAFDEGKIDYLPLKGCIMKPMYPKSEYRAMNDADILIRPEQYDKIKPIVQELGYHFLAESDCELKWLSSGLYLELHKRLIPSFIKDFYAYFGEGWHLAVKDVGTRYTMSHEDEFLFLFTHFARHYREGGVGIRHMCDLWLYQRARGFDEEKVMSVLKDMSLDVFYHNIKRTLAYWFENGPSDEITELITDYILGSGSFGTVETKALAAGIRDGGSKKKNVMNLLFPPIVSMRYAYPILKKWPVLLPFVWVWRWFKVLFIRRDKLKLRKEQIREMKDEKLDAYEAQLRAVGISHDFEEK